MDNEIKGEGNQQDYGMRIYDPRLGRFLSVDPITSQYPQLTPYQFASNRPIDGIDLDGLEFYSATNSYITIFVKYDPKLKVVTGGQVHFDLSSPQTPVGLDVFLKNRAVSENSIGMDATVATFDLPRKSNLIKTASEAEMKDISDSKAVGGDGVTLPKIPQNKKQEREQMKSRNFFETVGTNSARMDAIGATIEGVTALLEMRRDNYWTNYMKDVKWQTTVTTPLIVNILQQGIDNNIIIEGYRDDNSLTQLANYLMSGKEITMWDENNKLVKDGKLTKIGESLWKKYDEANKAAERQRLSNRMEEEKRAIKDNTRTNQ